MPAGFGHDGRRPRPWGARGACMQFALTPDQLAIQEEARRLTAHRITPFAAEWDEKHIHPNATIQAAAEIGFAAI